MALWIEPKWPGDAVREIMLIRGDEIGSIRIQHYGNSLLVACYLPGICHVHPGDSPKTEPEESEWCTSSYTADNLFDRYVTLAYNNEWQNYHRNKQ